MSKASDNAFPSVLLTEGTEPAAPAAGKQRLYIDSTTHKLKRTDSGGVDVTIEGNTSTVATDAIWDAAGDLAVGTGADTAAKLAKGNAGGVLAMGNSAVIWNAGTSFPASKATGDRYWRTDYGLGFLWNGTQWVSEHQYVQDMIPVNGTLPLSATLTSFMRVGFPYAGLFNGILLERVITSFFVSGGTALSSSHKWVGSIKDNTAALLGVTVNINSGASDAWRSDSQSMTTALANTIFELEADWTKTGTPGSLFVVVKLYYRIVAT